jgi:hypothetical protein
MGQRTAHQRNGFIHIEGLWQVFECAALVGRHRAVQVGVRGHDDHRQLGKLLADTRQQLQTAGAGHADVADQDVRVLTLQPCQSAVSVIEADRFHALLLQCLFQHPADGSVIINNPDIFSSAHRVSLPVWVPVAGTG